ncbi:thioredoxin family protein [Mesorhizobium sp. CN2-181]|uniref:thioredoxin family protein n=1 Tax=Mesorhizobium yinganensis TaxID=3157707 RepID=UPI0032B727A9
MKTLYKFGASWCSPCQAMDPLLAEIDQLNVVKVDIEQEPEKAQAFGVRSVPTLIIVDENENPLAVRAGGINRHQLQQLIRSVS